MDFKDIWYILIHTFFFFLLYHLVYLEHEAKEKKNMHQLQMIIIFHLIAKLSVDPGTENILNSKSSLYTKS